MHKENIKKVQIETVKIIKETQKIITNLIETESKNKNRNENKTLSYTNLTKHQEILHNEKQKLDNLEYVVAVVGTMKAGKSMTINAIVGQEVLPSREFPMTTLPTLITHKPKQETPILKLKKTEPFVKLVKDIKARKETAKTSEQSDMQELMEKILKDDISFKTSYEGQEQIESFLKQINDLMRIAKDFGIEPPYNDFTDVDDLPRIEVEFYHLAKEENNSNAKLTLLDTPGPDEFKHSALLKEIFKNQLQRASAVMLLVDYTKMNSQSDVEVKEQVKDVADMIGKQHLFVLLNKFDQRKRSDDVEEKKNEAKRLIAEDVLKDQIDKNNIYPISSKSAFYANFGLRELSKNGEIDTSLPWIDDFGVTLMGEDWEDDIDDIKRVKKKCEKTWEKSFFQEPLDNIIATIHSDALFLSLKSPLDKLSNLLREYSNAFKTRKNAYQKELKELKDIVKNLKKDIEQLNNISQNINDDSKELLNNVLNDIRNKTNKKIDAVFQKTVKNLNEQINKEYYEEKNKRRNNKNNESFWDKKLWDGGFFDIFYNDEQKREEFVKNGKATFSNPEDAKKFLKPIKSIIDNNVKNILNNIETQTNKSLNKLKNDININISEELKDILKEIEKKLSDDKGARIAINFPKLVIQNMSKSNFNIDETIEKKTVTKRKVKDSFLFGTVPNLFNSSWGKESYDSKSYIISKEDMESKINEQFKAFEDALIKDLINKFDKNIKIPLNDKLQLLTKEIESYRAEQIDILNEREKDDIDSLEKDVQLNEIYQKHITKLNTRVEESKNILGTNNE